MRVYIFLILVCAASTLARSKYKRETSDISFSDNAGISAGLNGAEGHFKKSIGLKPFLLNPFDKTSESKKIGLNIGGNIGLKPKLNLGEEDKGFGISFGGSGGLGVGISGSKEKEHSEKKQSKMHKQSKENSSSEKSSDESIIGEIWKEINNGISAGMKGDADLSFGTGGISANIDGDISAGANSKKDGSSSSKEEDVIVIPIVDGKNSTKNSGVTEDSKTSHTGGSITISHNSSGQTSDHREHESKTGTEENISRENNHGKHVNVTIDGSHSSHNKSKNSTGKIGVTDGKDSSHGKNNEDSNNSNEILNNGKCGSNIKQTLQVVQTFIRGCHAIVYFLLKLNEVELRRVLCETLPHDNKLSCQLGCNILRVIKHG